MKQAELDRAVALATGETTSTIKRLGFVLDEPLPSDEDPELLEMGPRVVDGVSSYAQRSASPIGRPHREPVLA